MGSQKVYTRESPLVVWHFAGDTLRDKSPLPKAGDVLPRIAGPIPCERGWHGSVRLRATALSMFNAWLVEEVSK